MRRAALTLIFVIACKDPPSPAPPPPPPAPPQDGVTLVQPGAEPRQALRYRFAKGSHTASTLVCDVSIKNDGQGDPSPALVVELDTVVDDVLADGSAQLRFTLTRTQLRDAAGGTLPADAQAEVAALQGVVIIERLAADGKSSGARLAPAAAPVPDQARAQLDSLLQSLEHVATQLPAEPVGVGAVWEERRTLPPGGITGVAETVYTVTAVTPGSFAYTSAGKLSGPPQTIQREGMTVEISNTTGHTEAKGSIELSRYAIDVTTSSVFSSTMNAIAPKDMPGSGSSTVEIKMATRMTPSTPSAGSAAAGDAEPFPAPSSAAPSGSDQGAHNAP